MKKTLELKLSKIAEEKQIKNDPSHDMEHVRRVLNMSLKIGKSVNADPDILIPAALFHDVVIYKKNSPKSKNASFESAKTAEKILKSIKEYPQNKIEKVRTCIEECSFSKGIKPNLLESKILQDADRLEATGAISIMRTFASCGQMNRQFYDPKDPFCKKGTINFRSGLDLFYQRLLIVEKTLHTKLAKKLARGRTIFLEKFLKQLEKELTESDIKV